MSMEEEVPTTTNGEEAPMTTTTGNSDYDDDEPRSALDDNIASKGKNAYYFAHAHKANGPKWDGKPQPKLLSKHSSSDDALLSGLPKKTTSSFDYKKSNITSYAFCDEDSKVKLYVELEGVGEQCTEEDITLHWTSTSLSLVVQNYRKPATMPAVDENVDSDNNEVVDENKNQEEADKPVAEPRRLAFGKLSGAITKASYKLKTNRLIVTLIKEKDGETWHTINDKGSPDHEVV
uniref:CS domain-containing protein n=1 Tax=Grammatophora oceanica TaxID=210454 RepID=A0A7S1Y207_9STRA|mmetsp:Transcript_19621/g.29039  ORF Transcript_19621/g.29039 Transcript_19621/m.29039 type:complete len:234 (+) Transcript_19621:94-795(+)|eukprot:CAMPEP_0194029750 /NCGR_PEP_ID=MMETSP0009_2-20130614/3410_1 /TAXON_ID=210454 /ORGANISM="Grammatophora oceanica, Strain CCMP 410" /LENGTH=233 /DNA_ID=CAMNT_0038669517 /DNA_START=94 /DNA_END=795 /DNA_ORIENTATION=+